MATIRLTHIDGALPNLALMKLAYWHRNLGDQVVLARTPSPSMFEPIYDQVYGSTIFSWSTEVVRRLRDAYPEAIIAGTGSGNWQTVEEVIGQEEFEHYDYSIYPGYPWSLGFTQRGCRLNCGFCVVPKKEGKPRSTNSIYDIWRPGTPRCVCLLDNDFFGQPEGQWRCRVEELRQDNFKVCFNQGINIRMITAETAAVLADLRYFDDQFQRHRLYTAWDNLGQEKVFFRGLELLENAGIPAKHLMVYMLVGYKVGETMEEVMYRYQRLKDAGCLAFPMVYRDSPNYQLLRRFARWVIRRYDSQCSFEDFGKKLGNFQQPSS